MVLELFSKLSSCHWKRNYPIDLLRTLKSSINEYTTNLWWVGVLEKSNQNIHYFDPGIVSGVQSRSLDKFSIWIHKTIKGCFVELWFLPCLFNQQASSNFVQYLSLWSLFLSTSSWIFGNTIYKILLQTNKCSREGSNNVPGPKIWVFSFHLPQIILNVYSFVVIFYVSHLYTINQQIFLIRSYLA